MSQQRTRAVSTAWMKRGLTWALGVTMALGCGSEYANAEDVARNDGTTLGTISQRLGYGGHEYVFVTTPRTWTDAETACADMGMGLVTLETSAEADWLLSQQPAGDVWIGLNDRRIEGAWVWVDGHSTYTRWNTGEPNNSNNEDCAISNTGTNKWNDIQCTSLRPFVCESFDAPQTVVYNGSEYTFFAARKTWLDAQHSCAELGQNLVSIQDADEELFLKAQAPTSSWWIGYNDRAKEGTWVWPDGASSYTNWRLGEPNDLNGNEDCAVGNAPVQGSQPAGKWNDLPCSDYVSYFCESLGSGPRYYQYVTYSTADTDSATRYTTDVTVTLQPGQILDVGTCGLPGVFATNDTYLRLLGPDGLEVMDNDDACKGSGSRIRYRVPPCGGGTYVIQAGCFESGSCGGRLGYTY